MKLLANFFLVLAVISLISLFCEINFLKIFSVICNSFIYIYTSNYDNIQDFLEKLNPKNRSKIKDKLEDEIENYLKYQRLNNVTLSVYNGRKEILNNIKNDISKLIDFNFTKNRKINLKIRKFLIDNIDDIQIEINNGGITFLYNKINILNKSFKSFKYNRNGRIKYEELYDLYEEKRGNPINRYLYD